MHARGFRFSDLVNERGREERVEPFTRGAAVTLAAVAAALFADFLELGVERLGVGRFLHEPGAASDVPNGN
jgi:hypothetical protein